MSIDVNRATTERHTLVLKVLEDAQWEIQQRSVRERAHGFDELAERYWREAVLLQSVIDELSTAAS